MTRPPTIKSAKHQRLVTALIKARQQSGISQKGAAKKLGVSQTWMTRLESGNRRVDVFEYIQLCRLFGIDWLSTLRAVCGEVPQKKPPAR